MKVSTRIDHHNGVQKVTLSAYGTVRLLNIPSYLNGPQTVVDGNELLLLALATCYCNDLYREASLRNIHVQQVEIAVSGQFDGPVQEIYYEAKVAANCSDKALEALVLHTDKVAGVHTTLRSGTSVQLRSFEAMPIALAA